MGKNFGPLCQCEICSGIDCWYFPEDRSNINGDRGEMLRGEPFFLSKLDYTCRARWPEGLLCSTISFKSCNLAQILQSPKSEFVTCVMLSTHTNIIKPHLTELDEIHRNRPKSNYNLAKKNSNLGALHQTDIGRTDRDSYIFYLVPPCRSRTQ